MNIFSAFDAGCDHHGLSGWSETFREKGEKISLRAGHAQLACGDTLPVSKKASA